MTKRIAIFIIIIFTLATYAIIYESIKTPHKIIITPLEVPPIHVDANPDKYTDYEQDYRDLGLDIDTA